MQAVKETLSNAKLRPTKMIQPNCSNLLQTLTLGCMLGLTGYFGGISADYKVYRAPIEPTLCHLHTTAMARFHLIGRHALRVYTPCSRFLAHMSAASCVTQLDHQTCRGSSIGRACGSYQLR
ncbi:hypothetical protein D6C77_04499 [Aureobasidium pullulans]|nr:hypothetical protein D6C77_04499 [Aureobasidium pullulans]TIA69179.1 hypothetical protein D6C76_07937 [Aureobasidium pullulans]